MPFYRIENTLVECPFEELRKNGAQYAAVLTTEEWRLYRDRFEMGIDTESELESRHETKALVNVDSLIGSFFVPERTNISGEKHSFAFALDEKGVVFIDDEGYAGRLIADLAKKRKWRMPSLERFLFDMLEAMIDKDLTLLENTEKKLAAAEKEILAGDYEEFPGELNDIRGDLLDLRLHYEQLIDVGQEFAENENGFFKPENLRYFSLFTERVARMQDTVTGLRDYVIQLRDLVQNQLTVKQNRIMTLLTVVTSIFMPLTLITGWYGMNFRYMPELDKPYAYPIVITVCLAIGIGCIIWFKKKKWM